ncbi:nitronate monooxygenase [bacterium DOLJORAL78_65_58]|nr:MAG: nitronate monooxygenase [bacterium DOLZORAL124_64_63]PIE76038.1 MAG: nitronate monooxygenase [bacterium DOLJORAL78_65_58]
MPTAWPADNIASLLGIRHPIIQGGMVYNSGAHLAAAVSEAGGLGLIGAGSMRPDLFRAQIRKARTLTAKPFGVNLPLLYGHSRDCLDIALEEGVRIFFTSAGSPRRAMGPLKAAGCTVVHVAASPELARKCQDAGCDAVVVEGFEAGGHNGREEITTMVLVPECVAAVDIPVIAAGGIASGGQMAAAFALGAAGVQIGSRFAITRESSGHALFKRAVVEAGAADTLLVMKKHIPVRLLRNAFREKVLELEARGADREELAALLGTGRARRGMLDGDLEEGELEIGQVAGLIDDVPGVAELMTRLLEEYSAACRRLSGA